MGAWWKVRNTETKGVAIVESQKEAEQLIVNVWDLINDDSVPMEIYEGKTLVGTWEGNLFIRAEA